MKSAIKMISQAVTKEKNRCHRLEIIVTGDFNRHDVLWGGNAVTDERQGEAKPIIDIMGNLGLISLLRSGTITRIQGEEKSTINLVLTTHGLTNARIICKVYDIVHGSDHVAIKSSFDLLMPKQTHVGRLLFKEAPWPRI